MKDVVQAQLGTGGKLSSQMGAVIDYAQQQHPHDDWAKFRKIPYDRIAPLRDWLTHRFTVEPPQTSVAGLWLGLCYTRHGSKTADLYLAASTRFSKSDSEFRWARECEYQPDYCFARSNILWKIYQGAHRQKGGLKEIAERPLCFAYAALAASRLLSELDPKLFLNDRASAGVAVGYENGEALLLGELTKDGFQLAGPGVRQKRSADGGHEKLQDRDSFWNLIAELLAVTRGLEAFEKQLDARLVVRPAAEIREFARQYGELLNAACTADVYGAATIIGCGSEDAFLDFRRWIVFQGPRQFARIVRDPDYLGIYAPESDPIEHWYSGYHPMWAYEKATGKELPNWKVAAFPSGGNPYGTDQQLAKRFPKLWKRMRRKRG